MTLTIAFLRSLICFTSIDVIKKRLASQSQTQKNNKVYHSSVLLPEIVNPSAPQNVVSPEAAPACSFTHSIHRYTYSVPILKDTNTFRAIGQQKIY